MYLHFLDFCTGQPPWHGTSILAIVYQLMSVGLGISFHGFQMSFTFGLDAW